MEPIVLGHYGVRERSTAETPTAIAAEDIRLCGFALVNGGYSDWELDELAEAFDRVRGAATDKHGGHEALRAIDEHNTVRAMLAYDPLFLSLARNQQILGVCDELLGPYYTLNQQNGVINPAGGEKYNQGAFHRDLPYQHFVSSRPLAINALFCVDAFTRDNGATFVLPATHKQEAYPSIASVDKHAIQVTAPRGSFIVLDCMMYHSGGGNRTGQPRRAVNHVYTIPPIRQQIDLPALLGDGFTSDPAMRQFLGYDVATPANVAEYYAARRRRVGGK